MDFDLIKNGQTNNEVLKVVQEKKEWSAEKDKELWRKRKSNNGRDEKKSQKKHKKHQFVPLNQSIYLSTADLKPTVRPRNF